MEVRPNRNTTFSSAQSPQSSSSSQRSGQSRELQKFLTTQPAWDPPEAEFDDNDFLTATWQGDTLVSKEGGSVVGSIETLERKKKNGKGTKVHATSTLTKKSLRQPAPEPIREKTITDNEHRRPPSRPRPDSEPHHHPGQALQQIRQRHNASRSPVPARRKSLNRAKSERLSKPNTSLDTHIIISKAVSRQNPDKPCDPPDTGGLKRSKSLCPVSPQESTITDLTDEDGLTSLSRSSSKLSNSQSNGSLESDPSRRGGLQRAHSESLLKALRQKTKSKMAEIEEDQEFNGPLRNTLNTRTRRSCSPSPRHAARPHNPMVPSTSFEGPRRIPSKANLLHREHSLSPGPEEDVSPTIVQHRRLSRAMSERIQVTAKAKEEQRISLHRVASRRGLNRHPSMTQLAAKHNDGLREVFDWNGLSSSSSSLLSDECTRSQSSCARSQSSQRSKHSIQSRRAASIDTSPPMPSSLKRSSSSDFPRNIAPGQATFSSRRGSVGNFESAPLEMNLSRRKSIGHQMVEGGSGRIIPRGTASDKVLSRRPSLRRMASNSSIDRRELLKRTGSNSSIDQYQITPNLRRSSSYVNRQAAHSLFYDNLRNSQRNLYDEVNEAATGNAIKSSLRIPCSKEDAMTFHGILKDVSASKQIFNSMLSK